MSPRRRHRHAAEPAFAPHDVIATFASMDDARRAIQSLQMAGIDAARITLFGAPAEEAAADLDVRAADDRFAGLMWRRTWVGGLVGALAGATVGGVGAAVVLHGAGPGATAVLWAAVVGTGVLGLGTGAATGATSAAQMSSAWELTFHTVAPGTVGVGVHTTRDGEAQRAVQVLARQRATQVERFRVDPDDGDPPPEPVRVPVP